MDGDGDLDIVSASHDDDTIAWYENSAACTVSDTLQLQLLNPTKSPHSQRDQILPFVKIAVPTLPLDGQRTLTMEMAELKCKFETISINPLMFDVQPQISATGTLTFTLKPK